MARRRRQPRGWWTEHGGVRKDNCTERLTKIVANMIFKMARDRTEDGREAKRGAMIKDNNRRLITESKEVLRILAANFKELLNGKGAASCLELPSSVRREVEVGR